MTDWLAEELSNRLAEWHADSLKVSCEGWRQILAALTEKNAGDNKEGGRSNRETRGGRDTVMEVTSGEGLGGIRGWGEGEESVKR